MSESQEERLSRIVAEAVEARQHTCSRCGHAGSSHAMDIYPILKCPEPCAMSCMECFDLQTKRLKQEKEN